jgi:hypothetical protein
VTNYVLSSIAAGSARGYPQNMMENGIRLRDMVWLEQQLDP